MQISGLVRFLWCYYMFNASHDDTILLLDVTEILKTTSIVLLVEDMEGGRVRLMHLTRCLINLRWASKLLHEDSISASTLLSLNC